MVGTLGLILAVVVHAASIQDRDGAKLVLARLGERFPRLRVIWADGGYAGRLVEHVRATWHWLLQIVSRPADATGFVVLPKRWIVERTFAWLGRCRRLAKDFENLAVNALAFLCLGMIRLMLRRLARLATA